MEGRKRNPKNRSHTKYKERKLYQFHETQMIRDKIIPKFSESVTQKLNSIEFARCKS